MKVVVVVSDTPVKRGIADWFKQGYMDERLF